MVLCLGCQWSSFMILADEAIRRAGSPARRFSSLTVKLRPVTFLTAAMISRTENPFSVPRL